MTNRDVGFLAAIICMVLGTAAIVAGVGTLWGFGGAILVLGTVLLVFGFIVVLASTD